MNSKRNLAALLLASLVAVGCSSSTKSEAEKHAAKIDSAMSKSSTDDVALPGMKPGFMPAGCYMRAVIDGKKWEATEMTPDLSQLSILTVNGKSGNSSIMFVISSKRDNVGQPSNLNASNQITYWGGEGFFVGGQSGQFTVTKMDDQFIDGTFNFTAEKDGKKVTCTNGEFRIPAPPQKSSN